MITDPTLSAQPSRIVPTEELIDSLALIGTDYGAVLAATTHLPLSDRRRCRQKARGRYARLLRQTIRSAIWLATDGEPEMGGLAS